MHNGQFGMKPVLEAPLLPAVGAVLGGYLGGGVATAGLAGFLTTGGLIGAGLGAVGGTLLGNALTPKMPSLEISQPAPQAVPATPAAPAIPAAPSTPTASPATGGGLGAPTSSTGGNTPVDTGGPIDVPFTPGEAATPTTEDIVQGELSKKRRGRVATILTTPRTRLDTGETDEDEVERLGG